MERQWKLGEDMSFYDEIGGGVTFDDVITSVQCNCREITPEAVVKEALACKRMRQEDFWFLLRRNIEEIIAEVKRRKGIE